MEEISQDDLNSLHKKLLLLKEQIEEILSIGQENTRPVAPSEAIGRLSRVDAMQQQQMAMANNESHRKRLILVGAALQRIDDEIYGECISCGEYIALSRLYAQPEARFCIGCQKLQENQVRTP